ncbi:hypothetical protein D3C72_2515090 [compost metagenome]
MPKPKAPTEKPQIDNFKEAARELETNEDEAAFDRAFKKVAKVSPPKDNTKG